MKTYEISFEYTAMYDNKIAAGSIQEALYKVMKEIYPDGGYTHIAPHDATIRIREVPLVR